MTKKKLQPKNMLFAGIGIVLLVVTLTWGIRTYQFTQQAMRVKGIVSRLNSGGSHPQIRFITQEGKEIEYPQNGLIFGYKTGDEVEVLYHTKNPHQAAINTFGALWGFPCLCFVLGLVFVLVATVDAKR
ncbi:MAG: DUF3592 domain-containing protein [Blastocatellia bacterium]